MREWFNCTNAHKPGHKLPLHAKVTDKGVQRHGFDDGQLAKPGDPRRAVVAADRRRREPAALHEKK